MKRRTDLPTQTLDEQSRMEDIRLVQSRLDALLNHDIQQWLDSESRLNTSSGDYEATLSWRITKPLRLARMFQLAARDSGVAGALRQALAFLGRRFGRQ